MKLAICVLACAMAAVLTLPTMVENVLPCHDGTAEIVQRLIDCESGGRNVQIIDSNQRYSYGILQFQQRTWDMFSRKSGIKGNPMVPADAIRLATWAVRHGYAWHWSCWNKIKDDIHKTL